MSLPSFTERPEQAFTGDQPKRDHRQEVTESIVQLLEQGVAPWQKPWEGLELPMNPTTGKAYRGGNAVHLFATAVQRGYEDPRWMTYKQAAENDWQIKKGEKGTRIEFWEIRQAAEPKEVADRRPDEPAEKSDRQFIHRIYTVFNAKQIDGIPAHQPKERTAFEAVEAGERILISSGARINHDQPSHCFYNRPSDSIHLTPKETFKDASGYYGTALHELSHWTGHPSRLNRSTLNESYRFGDQEYAKEELRAELASLFIAAETGIPNDPTRHAAYVGSWIEALKKDKNETFRAAHDASAAADFVLSLDRERTKSGPENKLEGAAEREGSRFVARLEPVSGTVSVHDKKFGNDHHTPIDVEQNLPASNEQNRSLARNKGSVQSELKESFQEARALAVRELGQEARTYDAQPESGIYRGRIIGETDHHIVQQISPQTAIAHLKKLLGETLEADRNLSISYKENKAEVREIRQRSRNAELAR